MPEGRIIKALSGFYYVQTTKDIFQCKGRGVFRKKNITPLVGDFVSFDIREDKEGYITEIKPRTNELIRPPIANISQAIIVSSAIEPEFSSTLLDRFLVLIEAKGIQPIIFITKIDLLTEEQLQVIQKYQADYEAIGYRTELFSTKKTMDSERIQGYLQDHVTVIAGQSGVGKSSLINVLSPDTQLKTADISKSLGRGKHTTRHVELIEINHGLVADTPGFSALDFDEIEAEELSDCFPEMRERKEYCKFRGCLHAKEPKCAVKDAVENGELPKYRYDHYISFLEEIQTRKPRY
ncbi:ribosome small subunit-dependent GTPase A [Ornithinibacillus massiliensis]|uniref:Small ribosomal subunit biogenesis GTPase RsgA n=1 Tax=Ornithinibacillus massiliensis TaxID=1944633 RepID=A0ABS5MCP0_9BACI|nr:ribosome small subunit-dependent GTPase A [Ornithinibacillus massiliensis]MBS3680097.1 ribosome small subunit-dependent GTPase A [Ornithinibacillus massiliensis]